MENIPDTLVQEFDEPADVAVFDGFRDMSEDELKKLYEIMRNTDGIYGGRFSGAGFKGCCMALVDPEKVEDIKVKVTEEYLKAFPELEGRYSAYVCESADGVRF